MKFLSRVAPLALLAGLLGAGPAPAANFSCSWASGVSGSWSSAADWSTCNGTDPNNSGGNTYDATIAVAGLYTVTLSSPVTIGTLTLNNSQATLANTSVLTTTGGVTFQAGKIQGGTIVRSGGTTALTVAPVSNGTLDGVTLQGSLDVTGSTSTLYFTNGLVVKDASGTNPGVINVTGSSADLYALTTQTLDNATVHLGGATGVGYLYAGAASTLTLGSGLHVLADGSGSYGYIYGANFINNGSMSFSNGSVSNTIVPTTFTNNGTVTVANGTSLQIGSNSATSSPTFINTGTVTANGSGGTTGLTIGTPSNPGVQPGMEWRNSGTISVTNTNLRLGGYFKTSDIGTINRTGGTTELLGYLDNSSSTLNVLAGMSMQGGTIHGGTVANAVAAGLYTVNSTAGTLDNVQVNGPLSITGTSTTAYFNNLVVKDATGTSPGVINVTGSSADLYSLATQTLDNATVHLGGTAGVAYIYSGSGTLTLGPGLQVLADGSGSYGYIYGTNLINNGSMSFSNGNANNVIAPVNFTNNGSIAASNGSAVDVRPTTSFTNFAAGTLTGGSYQAFAGSQLTLAVPAGQTLTSLAAEVVLSGAGSVIRTRDVSTNAFTAIETSLTSIASAGSLSVLAGRSYTTTNALTNAGTLQLAGGGTFTAAGLTNSGTLTVGSGSTLKMGAGGTGALTQSAGTTTIDGALTAGTVTINGGTLQGMGTVGGVSTIGSGGTLFGGSGTTPATLTLSSLTLSGTMGLIASSGTSYGVIKVTGSGAGAFTLASGSTLNLTNLDALNLPVGTMLTIGTSGSPVSGAFANVIGQTYDAGARTWNVLYNQGGDNIELTSASVTPVGNPAQASAATPNPIVFGNLRVGATAPSQTLSIGNTATAPADGLNASISTATSGLTASGSFTHLAAASTNTTSLVVGMSTAAAGARNGSATIALQSDGVTTGSVSSLPSQVINVTGGVYQTAQPSISTSVSLGNFHVGASSLSQAVAISNPYASGVPTGYQEGLDVASGATGGQATVSGGPITNLAAGAAASTAISVGLNGLKAGANSGSVTLAFASDGAGTSGLSTLPLGNQVINISGTGYNLAAGSATPAPVVINNQRVGGAASQALAVANTAPAGSFTEVLNASFGANTGGATNNGGSITGGSGAGGIAGGGSNNTAMSVGVDTSSSGAKSGTVTVNYVSNGTGTSALGNTGVGSQTINVSGNVYQQAGGQILTAPLNFGTVQVGQTVSQTLAVKNTASGVTGFVEDLGASFGSSSGTGASLISGSGSITGLAAGATNSSGMTVSVNTSGAATVNGAIAVNFVTEGTVNGVSNGLGVASVGSASYGVAGTIQTQGQVINDANPVVNNSPLDLGATRVGGAALAGTVSLTNKAGTPPQAALDASITGSVPITASGSVSLLAPGGTDSTHLQVGIGSSTSGALSGTATLALISDASNVGGCGSSCQLTLPSQTVTVKGNVYQTAGAQLNTTTPLFSGVGIVHVGDTLTQTLSVTNTASGALNDSLVAHASGASAGYTASGSAAIAGGATDTSNLKVSVNTSTAALLSAGTASFSLASHDSQLSDVPLAALSASVAGVQVNNYANPMFALDSGSGSLGHTGAQYLLDLGNLTQGSSATTDLLSMLNHTAGPSDLLKGSYTVLSTPAGLTLTGFDAFSGLDAGQGQSGLDVTFDPTVLGAFSGAVELVAMGYNASGYTEPFDLTLTIEGDVVKKSGVPEPGALALALCGGAMLWLFRTRRTRPSAC